jgi:formylglycine-generating enzyme required for sulfatase activity
LLRAETEGASRDGGRLLAVRVGLILLVLFCAAGACRSTDEVGGPEESTVGRAEVAATGPGALDGAGASSAASSGEEAGRARCNPSALEAMVRIAAGPAWVDSTQVRGDRKIEFAEIYIDRNEVTLEEYARCVEAGACRPAHLESCEQETTTWPPPGRDRHPVTCVGWADAVAYCAWRGLRPPTQLEWEKAARGSEGRLYPWGDEPAHCGLAVMAETAEAPGCGTGTTAEVGSRPAGASPYGVLDLAGNVAEWTGDLALIDRGVGIPSVRGGSFREDARLLQSHWHDLANREVGRLDVGIRCACSLESAP